jgi:hypothetical protein
LRSPQLPTRRLRCTLALSIIVTFAALPLLTAQAADIKVELKASESAQVFDPMLVLDDLRQRLATSYEYDARARLADLDRLVATARSLKRSDGTPIEVRFQFKRLSEGIEADVVAVSPTVIEISLNEACRINPSQIAVSFLHELVHIAQFAEGRLGYRPPRRGDGRWQAVGNDVIDEAEAYAESFWIAGTRAAQCPENLWGFLAAYREGWDSLTWFVKRERPTLPMNQLIPTPEATLLSAYAPHPRLGLRWFASSLEASTARR